MIDDFAAGIDLRKSAITAPAGTLRTLNNATITAGGEVTKRYALTQLGTLPEYLTAGLAWADEKLYVFGFFTSATVNPLLPAHVFYQQLDVPAEADPIIDRILDVQPFGSGKIYLILQLTSGTVLHYYDGHPVADTEAQGVAVQAHKSKLYAVDGANLRFSALRDATLWATGAGHGIIDVTQEDASSASLVASEEYFGKLALFGRRTIQIWQMDPDPAISALEQVLGNTGLVAKGAVARFGSGDVLYLSDTGIRSLRARDVASAAAVNDVGAAIDAMITSRRAILVPTLAERLQALVDPLSGHFWLVWGNEAFVLAAYPNSKISAWSRYSFPFVVDYATVAGSRLAFRSGDDLYIYGLVPDDANPFDANVPTGTGDELYDESEVDIVTPFLAAGLPATKKTWQALDLSCTGEWKVYVCPDAPDATLADQTPVWTYIATVNSATWNMGRIPIDMESTHLAVRLVCASDGPATIASMALHYDPGEQT